MKPASFRIIRFDGTSTYIGLAWNYDLAVLIATRDYPTYAEARTALDGDAACLGVELRWFDGEWHCPRGSEQLSPVQVVS